eukprot:3825518-Amphidinium_carterae.1
MSTAITNSDVVLVLLESAWELQFSLFARFWNSLFALGILDSSIQSKSSIESVGMACMGLYRVPCQPQTPACPPEDRQCLLGQDVAHRCSLHFCYLVLKMWLQEIDRHSPPCSSLPGKRHHTRGECCKLIVSVCGVIQDLLGAATFPVLLQGGLRLDCAASSDPIRLSWAGSESPPRGQNILKQQAHRCETKESTHTYTHKVRT